MILLTMCYRIFTHRLKCSIRPLLSNGQDNLVNSYAKPIPCSCQPDDKIKPWFRCEHHGCCRRISRIITCNDRPLCKKTWTCHVYEPRNIVTIPWSDYGVFDRDFVLCQPWSRGYRMETQIPCFDEALRNFVFLTSALLTLQNSLILAEIKYDICDGMWKCEDCDRKHNQFNCIYLQGRHVQRMNVLTLKEALKGIERSLDRCRRRLEGLASEGERHIWGLGQAVTESESEPVA